MCPSPIETRITARQEWSSGLATLRLAENPSDFKPGQFMNLGLWQERAGASTFISRSYSVASAPGAPLEFLIARVERGELSPSLLSLKEGDSLSLDPTPQGFFTFDYLPPHRDLWLIATGTGLGPFLSMLRSGQAFQRAERVILLHGVRGLSELSHRAELEALTASQSGRFYFVPTTSRETSPLALHGRVTSALGAGELERRVGFAIDRERAHVMLCGNPQMIEDARALLGERGLTRHRQRSPGHITTEKYW